MTQTTSGASNTARALSLLGSGVGTEATAAALGVTPAAISQLLAQESFAEQVTHLRYENLQQHNRRDSQYDSLEDALLLKLEKSLALIMRPEMILRAITTINAAKRRGQSAPQEVSETAQMLTLTLPRQIVQTFITNNVNQVVQAGDQSLHTMPSSMLVKQLKDSQESEQQLLPPELGDTSEHQIEATS